MFLTPWSIQSMEFSRPEYWSGNLGWAAFPIPGIKLRSPALQADSLPAEPQGSAGILEWVAYHFNRSSQRRNWTGVSCITVRFFTNWVIREAQFLCHWCTFQTPSTSFWFCFSKECQLTQWDILRLRYNVRKVRFFTIWANREVRYNVC